MCWVGSFSIGVAKARQLLTKSTVFFVVLDNVVPSFVTQTYGYAIYRTGNIHILLSTTLDRLPCPTLNIV